MVDVTWTYEAYIPDDKLQPFYTVNMKRDYAVQGDIRSLGDKPRFTCVSGVVDTNGTTVSTRGLSDASPNARGLEGLLERVAVDYEAKHRTCVADIAGGTPERTAIDNALGVTPPRTDDTPPTMTLMDGPQPVGNVTIHGQIVELQIEMTQAIS